MVTTETSRKWRNTHTRVTWIARVHSHADINTATHLCEAPARLLQNLESNLYFEGTWFCLLSIGSDINKGTQNSVTQLLSCYQPVGRKITGQVAELRESHCQSLSHATLFLTATATSPPRPSCFDKGSYPKNVSLSYLLVSWSHPAFFHDFPLSENPFWQPEIVVRACNFCERKRNNCGVLFADVFSVPAWKWVSFLIEMQNSFIMSAHNVHIRVNNVSTSPIEDVGF